MLFPPPPPQQLPEDQIATNQSLEQEILITDNQSQSNIKKHKTNLNITEDDYKKQTQHLVKLLSTPVPKNNNRLNPNDCFIGPFKGSTLFYYITPKEFQELHLGYQSTNKYTTFQAHLRSIVKKENTFNDDLYARFDTQTDSIFLHYSQPKNFKKDTPIPQMLAECNLIQNLLSATHEINHRTDFNSLQSYNLYSSPINDAKFSLFSEKKSIATELLTLTNLYHKLKEQGVNTFSFTTLI